MYGGWTPTRPSGAAPFWLPFFLAFHPPIWGLGTPTTKAREALRVPRKRKPQGKFPGVSIFWGVPPLRVARVGLEPTT